MVDYHAVLTVVSQIIGWIYFFAWSLSFYPQVWDNFYRKSVVGLSFDFLALNILGHSSYLVYNVVLFWDRGAQDLYRKEHPDATSIPVELNDVIFSIHAVTLTIITIIQCFVYERAKQTVSWLARILIGLALLAIAVVNILALCKVVSWLFVLNFLGFVKMGCSFVKYCPQVYMNYKRKMTVGWSIGNILLDFSGGVLSILQMVLNAINKGNWSEFYNFTKVGLGLLSIVFDLIFVLQHYVIYRKSNQEYWRKFREEKQKGTHYYESESAEREKMAINIDGEPAPGQEKEDSPLVAKDFQQREQSQAYEPHYPTISPSSPTRYHQ